MVEGDLWRYCHTDLTDFYRGALTARQIWVRIDALPRDQARIFDALATEVERDEQNRKADEIEALLATFKPQREG